MGTQSTWGLLIKSPIMKYLVLFALLAVAYAEPEAAPKADADAGFYYGGYPYYGYGAYHYPRYHYIGKREAEAAPKADADAGLYYGGWPYYGYGAYHYYPRYHYIGKREAEAAPEADADAHLLQHYSLPLLWWLLWRLLWWLPRLRHRQVERLLRLISYEYIGCPTLKSNCSVPALSHHVP